MDQLSVVLCCLAVLTVQAHPPPGYLGKSAAQVVEVTKGQRSLTSRRQFHIHHDGEHIHLDLVPSRGLLPKVLKVTAFGTDEDGRQAIDDWTHTTGEGMEVFVDLENSASILIDDDNGPPQLRGRVGSNLVIEPVTDILVRRGNPSPTTVLSHILYRVNKTVHPAPAEEDIEIPEILMKNHSREKRQQISQIYVPLHIVINYDYYTLMGSDVTAVIAYVKTFFAGINAYFGLITQPRVQISIEAIDIYTTLAEAQMVEKHRHASGGLVAGEVLQEFRKWAVTERARLGDKYAAIMVMTGTKHMCTVPHGDSKELCQNIAGLTVESAACTKFGNPFPGISYRVAIALDDYAYSGIIATTHEVGHMLGMSHDGSKSNYDKNAPSAESCSFYDYHIMGQQNFIKAHTRWSDCSLRQLQYWVQDSGRADCVTGQPSASPYPFDSSTLTVHDVNKQCQIRHGASAIFPSFCQKIDPMNEEICYKLMCYDNVKKQCQFGYGAAPGTPCGPDGQVCYQGSCQNSANLGLTQAPPAAVVPGVTVPSGQGGGCVDKQITLGGLSCRDWLSKNLAACDHPTITDNCCQSRAQLCQIQKVAKEPVDPGNGGKCVDTNRVTILGKGCAEFLAVSSNAFACDWGIVKEHCCASKAQYCNGGGPGVPPVTPASPIASVKPQSGNSGGCVDTGHASFSGKTCAEYLSGPAASYACNWDVVNTHCCGSKAKYCNGGGPGVPPVTPASPIASVKPQSGNSGGCVDTGHASFSGKTCAEYLSGPAASYACNWDVVNTHCCGSKAKYCSGNSGGVIG